MKKHFTCLLLFLSVLFSSGQNSWVQRLNFLDMYPYINSDSLTGICDIAVAADGSILVLASLDQDHSERVFKIPVTGSPVTWAVPVGYHSGMSGQFARSIRATADSGCIVSTNYWTDNMSYSMDGVFQKYSSAGLLEWSRDFTGIAPYFVEELYDAIQNNVGNYYALTDDSLYEIDNSGNVIFSTDAVLGSKLYQFSNGKLLVQHNTAVECVDPAGTVFWTFPSSSILAFTPGYFFMSSAAGVQKVDLNGTVLWTKTYPWSFSGMDATADGGFIASFGYIPGDITSGCWTCDTIGFMFRADANGDTLWSHTYDFPHYGLSCVKQMPSGNIITGGAFVFTNKEHTFFQRDYSAFIASLDSLGNGNLQTTTLTWPGDANNNLTVGFNDDALYVGIAWGDTGQPRDTFDMMYSMFQFMPGAFSDYASDWTNFFANGANHKHADFNGDGIIDNNDLTPYSMGYYFPFTIPSWRTVNPDHQDQSLPNFSLVAEHDTVPPGGLIKYFVIAGSANLPVDSVYGFVLSSYYDYTLLGDTPHVNYYSSNFGIPGNNVVGFDFPGTFISGLNMMMCRTDHNNVYQLNDTVAEISMHAAAGIASLQTFVLSISNMNSLTFHETPVMFNLNFDSVVIDPASTVSVGSSSVDHFKIFPNPADKFLIVSQQQGATTNEISIFNLFGEKVKSIKSTDGNSKINVEDLPNGFYSGASSSEESVKNFSFMVQH